MDAYELSNEALLQESLSAWMRAGVSNSSSRVDLMARTNLEQAHFLKGVVLARLEGEKPPFKPGDIIICIKPGGAHRTRGNCFTPMRGWAEPQKVVRVYYKGNKTWELKVSGHNNDEFYRAKDFTLAEPTDNPPPDETA